MFDIGLWEFLLIVVMALIIIAPERLPGAARKAGYWVGRARRFVEGVRSEVESEVDLGEFKRLLHNQEVQINELQRKLQAEATQLGEVQADLKHDLLTDEPSTNEPFTNQPPGHNDSASAYEISDEVITETGIAQADVATDAEAAGPDSGTAGTDKNNGSAS